MGGYGSTRWQWHTKKTPVESCRQLDAVDLLREGVLGMNTRKVGIWCWLNAAGKPMSCLMYMVDTTDMAQPWIHLSYTFTATGKEVNYKVRLQTTQPYFGGHRLWFVCPLQSCGQRVRILYLPPGAVYYGCRRCYNLTYRSCQESDKRISALRRRFGGDMHALLDAANRGEVDSFLALEAALRLLR